MLKVVGESSSKKIKECSSTVLMFRLPFNVYGVVYNLKEFDESFKKRKSFYHWNIFLKNAHISLKIEFSI